MTVQQEESTATGAGQFAPYGAMSSGDIVPLVDLRSGNALREPLLRLPRFVQ